MSRSAGVLVALALSASSPSIFAAESPATGAPVTATRADQEPARPAESGAQDTAATVGPLAIGAAVHDPAGALIGHIVLLTTDEQGRSVAKVRNEEDVYTIPTDDLFVRGGSTFSRSTLDQLRRGGAIAAGPAR